MKTIESLHHLISRSVSPYHCIIEAANQLKQKGFKELPLGGEWELSKGNGYYIKAYDSTLIAFTVGSLLPKRPKLRIAASHTDWPCLKLKPSPEISSDRYGKLNVEVYGGPILNTWLDRPLSMAGKVCVKGKNPMEPVTLFADYKRPVLTIPNLAIHMNRDVNKGVELNAQIDMLPLITLITDTLDKDSYFLKSLAREADVDMEDILDYEIYIYNAEEGVRLGLNQEFYSAPRLDNLTSVHACLEGLMNSFHSHNIHVIALYDNEEIGNSTKQGAGSALLDRILEKIYSSLGYSREIYLDALSEGFLLSLDVAHALHPNHTEKSDIKNQILLGDGIALKLSASQSYATDASSVSMIEGLCREEQIPYKKFSNRSDLRGGSTLGSVSSCLLAMRAADIGITLLAMHSCRELMAAEDQAALVSLVKAYFHA